MALKIYLSSSHVRASCDYFTVAWEFYFSYLLCGNNGVRESKRSICKPVSCPSHELRAWDYKDIVHAIDPCIPPSLII